MTTLRGEMPEASLLAVALLLVQLIIAGLGAGGALAGTADRHLCTAASGASKPRGGDDHRPTCPCLSAGCCSTSNGGPLPEGDAGFRMRAPLIMASGGPALFADPERRPLALFARAGRGPPPSI